MASSLPGPGTILTGVEVRFSEAVTFPATVEVRVEVRGRVRRITRAAFRYNESLHLKCLAALANICSPPLAVWRTQRLRASC